jgi:hypothetical protein
MTSFSVRALATLACGVALLAGCEDENNDPGTPNQEGTIQVDASTTTAYFSFADEGLVTPATPSASDEWDLSFRRFTIGLNGGVGGTKGVTAYNLKNNSDKTAQELLTYTPENQLAAFEAIGEADIPADAEFTSDDLIPTFTAWFTPTQTGLNANPAVAWKLKLATGTGHAAFRVSAIDNADPPTPADGMEAITIEYRLEDGTLGAPLTVNAAIASGSSATINLTTGVVAPGPAPQDCSWDLRVTRGYELQVNALPACGAGTFPLRTGESFGTITTAADAPEYAPFVSVISGPIPATFDDPDGPFLYGLDNDQVIYPTFNIYLVKVGDAVYKVQLTDYYSSTAQSGFPTMRYARIR